MQKQQQKESLDAFYDLLIELLVYVYGDEGGPGIFWDLKSKSVERMAWYQRHNRNRPFQPTTTLADQHVDFMARILSVVLTSGVVSDPQAESLVRCFLSNLFPRFYQDAMFVRVLLRASLYGFETYYPSTLYAIYHGRGGVNKSNRGVHKSLHSYTIEREVLKTFMYDDLCAWEKASMEAHEAASKQQRKRQEKTSC